jgi:hypothetical protein
MRCLLASAIVAVAANLAVAQERPARPLGAVVASSAAVFGTIGGVRALPDGRILVNDIEKRKLVLLDANLVVVAILADDSTGGSAPAYGGTPARLIPYEGDSTLFVAPDLLLMRVVTPRGSLGRAMAVPNSEQVWSLVSAVAGTPGFDRENHVVYRVMPPPQSPYRANGVWTVGKVPADSAPIVRASLRTRRVDTVAYTRIAPRRLVVQEAPGGKMAAVSQYNPMPVSDEWAVASDGSIAILRSRDYHVDWVAADGRLTSSPPVPFQWDRLTDDKKARLLERVSRSIALSRSSAGGAGSAPPFPVVSASELPDYVPPFGPGSVLADEDRQVWVQTSAAYPNATGAVYDVIDREGKLVDRIEIPSGRLIIGFARSGVVFLSSTGRARLIEKLLVPRR